MADLVISTQLDPCTYCLVIFEDKFLFYHSDNRAAMRDLRSKQDRWSLRDYRKVYSASFSHDGSRLLLHRFVSFYATEFAVMSVENGQNVCTISPQTRAEIFYWPVIPQFFARDRLVVFCSQKKEKDYKTVWHCAETGARLGQIVTPTAPISFCVSPTSQLLAMATAAPAYASIRIYDLSQSAVAPKQIVRNWHLFDIMVLSADDTRLVGFYGSGISVYDIETGVRIRCISVPALPDCMRLVVPDIRTVVCVSQTHIMRLDLDSGACIDSVPLPEQRLGLCNALSFSTDGRICSISSFPHRVYVYDLLSLPAKQMVVAAVTKQPLCHVLGLTVRDLY
jgi:hypothetical protein